MKFKAGLFILIFSSALFAEIKATILPGLTNNSNFFTKAILRIENLENLENFERLEKVKVRDTQGGPVITSNIIAPPEKIIEIPLNIPILSTLCEYQVELTNRKGQKLVTTCKTTFPPERIVTNKMIDPDIFDTEQAIPKRWPIEILSITCGLLGLMVLMITCLKLIKNRKHTLAALLLSIAIFSSLFIVYFRDFTPVFVTESSNKKVFFVSSLFTKKFKTPENFTIPLYVNETDMLRDAPEFLPDGRIKVELIPGFVRVFKTGTD